MRTLPNVPNEVYVPYWTLEPGWHTGIELRNNLLTGDLTVTPSLRTAAGVEVALSPVTVKPNEVTVVDLHAEAMKFAPQLEGKSGAVGSAVLRYTSPFAQNLYAGSMVHLEGKPIAYHFDAMPSDPTFDGDTSREGIWWLPTKGAEGHLIVTNASSKPSISTLTLFSASGKAMEKRIALGPRQMRRLSMRELVTEAGFTETSGGLRIQVEKGSESIYAAQVTFDETTGFSALLRMFERNPAEKAGKVTLRAPMMALSNPDPVLLMPKDTVLRPQIFLRNAAPEPIQVKAVLRWRDGDKSGKEELGTFNLPPGGSETVEVFKLQDEGKIPKSAAWGTVYAEYHGRYGDLVAIAASYEAEGRYGLQTPFNDLMAARWVGSRWYADTLHSSIITVGNGSGKATTANLTLHYNQGKDIYEVEQKLEPGEQIWLDVQKAIRNQIPDKLGRTIPQNVEHGSYSIRDMGAINQQRLFEGKLTIDRKFGFAAYGCSACCDPTNPVMYPNWNSTSLGATWQMYVSAISPCTGDPSDVTDLVAAWGSTNSSVATISQGGLAHAEGPGSGTLNADIMMAGFTFKCPLTLFHPSQSGTVRPSVQITGANVVEDRISVTLGSSTSGTLTLEAVFTNGSSVYISSVTRGPGSFNESFNIPQLPYGEFSSLRATYVVNGISAQHTFAYNMFVLGQYRHSQYNSPSESACLGNQAAAYVLQSTAACFTNYLSGSLKSDFFSQVDLNGSGHSVNYADIKSLATTVCNNATQGRPPDATGGANGNSFVKVPAITGSCSIPMDNNVVARCAADGRLSCGDTVYIHGVGVKTVGDSCPACCNAAGAAQLDNYTLTNQSCVPGSINDLGNFKTIKVIP